MTFLVAGKDDEDYLMNLDAVMIRLEVEGFLLKCEFFVTQV